MDNYCFHVIEDPGVSEIKEACKGRNITHVGLHAYEETSSGSWACEDGMKFGFLCAVTKQDICLQSAHHSQPIMRDPLQNAAHLCFVLFSSCKHTCGDSTVGVFPLVTSQCFFSPVSSKKVWGLLFYLKFLRFVLCSNLPSPTWKKIKVLEFPQRRPGPQVGHQLKLEKYGEVSTSGLGTLLIHTHHLFNLPLQNTPE